MVHGRCQGLATELWLKPTVISGVGHQKIHFDEKSGPELSVKPMWPWVFLLSPCKAKDAAACLFHERSCLRDGSI